MTKSNNFLQLLYKIFRFHHKNFRLIYQISSPLKYNIHITSCNFRLYHNKNPKLYMKKEKPLKVILCTIEKSWMYLRAQDQHCVFHHRIGCTPMSYNIK